MPTLQPIAFFSYVHFDDNNDSGYLTKLRNRLSAEVRAQTGNAFPIFQDRDGIDWGQKWKERIQESLDSATFLIPIITPSFFKSPSCRDELRRFLEREKKLGRNDLILPIYYIEAKLDDQQTILNDELVGIIASHQYVDWRNLRTKPFTNAGVGNRLKQIADQIQKAIERVNTIEQAVTQPIPTSRVDLLLEGEFNEFTSSRQQEIIGVLATLLRIDIASIRILKVSKGSVAISMEMPDDAAYRLYEMAVTRDIRVMSLGIKSVLVGDREIIKFADTTAQYSDEDILMYLKFIISQCARLDPRGLLRGSKTHDVILPLEDVFVTLKTGLNNPWEREAEQNLLDSDVEEELKRLGLTILDNLQSMSATHDFRYATLAREAHMLLEKRLQGGETINFDKAFQEHRWLAILGDPGSGKTTLLHWLSLQFARAFLEKKERAVVSSENLGRGDGDTIVDLGPVRFPILLRIADYSKARRENASLTIFDYLGHQPILGQFASLSQEKTSAISRDYVKRGKAILLLDGLDEITDSADRRKIRDEIERFIEDYVKDPSNEQAFASQVVLSDSNVSDSRQWWVLPNLSSPTAVGGNQIVITSRIAGYKNAVLRGEIKHYSIEPLDDKSVEKFCRKWTLAVERYLAFQSEIPDMQVEEKAFMEADALIGEIFQDKGVRKLATNPLLLTILALLHREQSHLPSHRIELYRQATQALIERRETALTEPQVIDILGPFALWLLENEPTGLATESELIDQINAGMKRWLGIGAFEELPGKFKLEIENFINSAREQAGILVARGEGLYGFMHLTFLEYFVARELTRTSSKVKDNILRYLHRPRWQEALLLAIANVSAVQRGDLADLMKSMLDAPSEHEDILHRNLLFAASCVADTVWMPPEILRRVASELMVLYADKNGSGRFKTLRKQLIEAFENVYRPDTAEIIEGMFSSFLKGNNSRFRACAGEILAQVTWVSSELLAASIDALKLPGIPDTIIDGINGLLKRGARSSKEFGELTLTTLQSLYSEDARIASAIDSLKVMTPEKYSFLENYGTQVNPIIIPVIANLLKKYDSLKSESFTSNFWLQLREALFSIADTSAGFGYTSTLMALAYLDDDLESVLDTIRKNIVNGKNREESIDLYLASFPLSEDSSFSSWWENLSLEIKKQFFKIAIESEKGQVLEEQAWISLGETDKGLGILALKLLTSLHTIALSKDRLNLLESFMSAPNDELAQIAGDILEHASLPEDSELLILIQEKLREWLTSESYILRSFGAIILASFETVSEETYYSLIETLRSSDDRLRQFADRVMYKPRLASALSSNVIKQAIEADWYEGQERQDGLATLAHQNFIRSIFHDIPEYIQGWEKSLTSSVSPQESDIIQCGLGNVELCAPNVLNLLLELITQTEKKTALESMLNSLSWITRHKFFDEIPENIIATLADTVLQNDDDEIRILASRIIGYLDSQSGFDVLSAFTNSDIGSVRIAGVEGIGSMAISGVTWRTAMADTILQLVQSNSSLTDAKLRHSLDKTWIRLILLSERETSNALRKIVENIQSDTLRLCLESGEGDDSWDEALCNDGTGFHSKLVDVIRLMIVQRPLLLEELAEYVVEVLELPKTDWGKKRIPLGVLSACAQELPANLAQLTLVPELENKLLDAASDPNSFNIRRFSIVTLCQLRRVSPKILDVLASGCRDLGIVQNAVFQAIKSLRLIDIEAIPQLMQLLSSPSTATKYAAAMIIREIGSSAQAVKQYGLRVSIANGLSNCIREITFSRHLYIDNQLVGELDEILFATLVRVTADNPQELYSEDAIAESRLALTSLQEMSANPLSNLETLQSRAKEMQAALQDQNFIVETDDILISMSGDQRIQRLELAGVNQDNLINALNESIKRTQEIAARFLIDISSNSGDNTELDEDERSGGVENETEDTPPELLQLRRQANRMQSRLRKELVQVEQNGIKVITRGDQFFTTVAIEGKEHFELVNALNDALKRSQELAARKLVELSSQAGNNTNLEDMQGDTTSFFSRIRDAIRTQENMRKLQHLRDQAQEMQKALQAESITVEGSGIQLIISADQKIQHLEYKGRKNEKLSDLINKAIKESQQIAADLLSKMSSSLKSLLGSRNAGGQPLDEVRKQALDMQARLQKEHIKLEDDDIIIVLRGDQLFESIYINGENATELTEMLNEAMKKSQQIAASKLKELSIPSRNNGDPFEIV